MPSLQRKFRIGDLVVHRTAPKVSWFIVEFDGMSGYRCRAVYAAAGGLTVAMEVFEEHELDRGFPT